MPQLKGTQKLESHVLFVGYQTQETHTAALQQTLPFFLFSTNCRDFKILFHLCTEPLEKNKCLPPLCYLLALCRHLTDCICAFITHLYLPLMSSCLSCRWPCFWTFLSRQLLGVNKMLYLLLCLVVMLYTLVDLI